MGLLVRLHMSPCIVLLLHVILRSSRRLSSLLVRACRGLGLALACVFGDIGGNGLGEFFEGRLEMDERWALGGERVPTLLDDLDRTCVSERTDKDHAMHAVRSARVSDRTLQSCRNCMVPKQETNKKFSHLTCTISRGISGVIGGRSLRTATV